MMAGRFRSPAIAAASREERALRCLRVRVVVVVQPDFADGGERRIRWKVEGGGWKFIAGSSFLVLGSWFNSEF